MTKAMQAVHTFVAWNWKANGASSANTDGDINSTVSANTTAGFSIVSYTGTLSGNGNTTIGHGLGAAPEVIITKSLTSNGENWGMFIIKIYQQIIWITIKYILLLKLIRHQKVHLPHLHQVFLL